MSAEPSPADLLGASSLLLAALAVLYGVWYASIEAAKERALPSHKDDAKRPLAEIDSVLHSRAYPLCAASALAALVYIPEAVAIVLDTVRSFSDHGLGAFGDYDPIEAALLLVTVGLTVLSIHVGRICLNLRKKLEKGSKLPA